MATRLSVFQGAYGRIASGALETADVDADGFTEEPAAQVLWNVYPALRTACLNIRTWPWTLKRDGPLSRTAAGPGNAEAYAHAMPGDAIGAGPTRVFDTDGQPILDSWRATDLQVYTDAEQVWIEYQYDAPEAQWPEPFEEYVILRLCAATCRSYGMTLGDQQIFAQAARDQLMQLEGSGSREAGPELLFGGHASVIDQRLSGAWPLRPIVPYDQV